MSRLAKKIKPSHGFSHSFYIALNLLLPLVVFALVRADFAPVALAVILLSKWRVFAVRPRFWLANIRTNAVDTIVGLSVLALMHGTDAQSFQLLYAGLWMVWLVFIKPRNDVLMMSLQAFIGQTLGLVAVFSTWDHMPLWVLIAATGAICFFAAHHFFYSFDEEYLKLLATVWAYFAAALAWILGHWLIFYYQVVAQPVLILTAMAFSLGTLYYLDHFDKLSQAIRRQIIFIMVTLLLVVVIFSDWGDKIV